MNYVGFIYKWTNKINGKKYLGSHKGNIDDRYIGSGKAFNNAINKYGIHNFEREIIEYIYEVDKIKSQEQYYLDLFECAKSDEYYNISLTSTGGNMGQDYSLTSKKVARANRENGCYKKQSEKMKRNNPNANGVARKKYIEKYGVPERNWKPDDEFRQKCRTAKLGNKNPRFGKPGTMRTTTYLINVETKNIDYTFTTLAEAEEYLKVNHATVWYNRKRNRPHKGYYWCVGDKELENIRKNNECL